MLGLQSTTEMDYLFLYKKGICDHIENDKLLKKKLVILHDVKKKKLIFLTTHLFLIFVNKDIFYNNI